MHRQMLMIWLMVSACLLLACSRYEVIPDDLRGEVDRTVTFEQVKESPSSYKGRLIVVGGEVLSVKRLEDRTRLEVLELPLTNALTPISERAQSNGRFVAYDRGKEILDPAIFDEGTPITIVAEVLGTTAAVQVDESKQEYPAFRIRDLTVWPNQRGDVLAPTYRPPFMWGSYGYRPYNMW